MRSTSIKLQHKDVFESVVFSKVKMPILLKNYTWHQNDDEIIVRIKFPQRIKSKMDIFTHKAFIKINCTPYYFEKFLRHSINETTSRCKILEQEVIFYLNKLDNVVWDALEIDICKTDQVKVKEDVIKEAQDELEKQKKEKLQHKDDLKKDEIHKEIERDTKIRERIENHNKNITNKAVSSIEKWKDLKNEKNDSYRELFYRPAPVNPSKVTPHVNKRIEYSQPSRGKSSKPLFKELPPIRQCSTIEVEFSDRKFTTPSRESTEQEEMEWLMKQNAAQKATGFVEDDLRPEERNPQWLKEKGDSFLKQHNYLGAISAYSTAIRLTNKNYELYFNRALAHFPLENYNKCAEDCSTALDLLTPHCEGNRVARVNCMARRGLALSRVGYIREGFNELLAALKLDPKNENLIQQAEILRCKLEKGEGK